MHLHDSERWINGELGDWATHNHYVANQDLETIELERVKWVDVVAQDLEWKAGDDKRETLCRDGWEQWSEMVAEEAASARERARWPATAIPGRANALLQAQRYFTV